MKSGTHVPKDISPYSFDDMSETTASGRAALRKKRGNTKVGDGLSTIERDAYERGFAAGEEAGHALGMKKVEQSRKRLAQMIGQLEDLEVDIVKAAEKDILAIALAVSQRILGKEVTVNSERIMRNIQDAIKKIGQSERIVIRLAPADLEMIAQDADALSQLVKDGGKIKFEANEDLSPGECMIDGRERMVDTRFKSQIAVFADAFSKEAPEP